MGDKIVKNKNKHKTQVEYKATLTLARCFGAHGHELCRGNT